jgi:4-alpha-glucanotransferase
VSDEVKLLFGVHAHQPAGNFPEVIRDAHLRCYGPFLEVLERHPDFPFAMHVSGWLLEFLMREFPEDMRRLRAMVERGQTEIFGGGDTEPVLAALPEKDRRGQLRAMNERLRRRLSVRPRGAWLTERVWEATIVPALVTGGIEYVAVDDYHFLCAGQSAQRLGGHFSTEEDGRRLDLFPISETLRYKIPFAPVADAIGHLESLPAGAAIYFDDIEKFGIWPETHEWVYGRRWLEDFIEAVIGSRRVVPTRYDEYHAAHASQGIVYLPTVSYTEMGEWTLPPQSSARFAQLVERAKREGTFELDKPYLRGGHWRNFFSRYPESNRMHKRMEAASRRFHALRSGQRTKGMRDDLHLAQANDAYWHGLFGGIYLPHLRRQVYSALARLERAVDAQAPRERVERSDIDLDGRIEVSLWNPSGIAIAQPHAGASVCEFTHYGLAHNFCDTLARREEHYYDKIRAGPVGVRSDAPASIHERVAFRSHISNDDLVPDHYPRSLFVDFWRPDGGAATFVHYVEAATRGVSALFVGGVGELAIKKRLKLETNGLSSKYDLTSSRDERGAMTVELNISMPSCDGPGGAYVIDGQARAGFGEELRGENCAALDLVDSELSGCLCVRVSPPAQVEARPLYTVSQSESGFEKIMQAATVRLTWPLRLDAGATQTIAVRLLVRQSR